MQVIRTAEYQVKEKRAEDRGRKTPGRETEKPAPGVNSRAGDRISELVNWRLEI